MASIQQQMESQVVRGYILQQIKLLKKRNALKIVTHVPGRAAVLEFTYSGNFFGKVVVKGDAYREFKEAGGFNKLTEEEMLEVEEQEETPEMKPPEPEPKTEPEPEPKPKAKPGQKPKAEPEREHTPEEKQEERTNAEEDKETESPGPSQ